MVRFALNLIAFYAGLSSPFIPTTADKMAKSLGVEASWPGNVREAMARLAPGAAFSVPDNLFAKITDEDRDAWAAQFAGQAG